VGASIDWAYTHNQQSAELWHRSYSSDFDGHPVLHMLCIIQLQCWAQFDQIESAPETNISFLNIFFTFLSPTFSMVFCHNSLQNKSILEAARPTDVIYLNIKCGCIPRHIYNFIYFNCACASLSYRTGVPKRVATTPDAEV
jgi:hypothetical protein